MTITETKNWSKLDTKLDTYDVVIMGAGFAGNCQARHLMLNIPGIKVAIIDPRSPERDGNDLKVGESLVEITAMFLYKELGLSEYLIENHPPKYGLTFHWAKDSSKSQTIDDYHHIWVNGSPTIESFHLNRAKFERDILQMNREMGATFYNGRVVDLDITPEDELHTIQVKVGESKIALKAKHLIDGAGRRFLIGKKTDNLIFDFDTDKLGGLNTGSAWLRVKNIDPKIFDKGYDPSLRGASRYYTTHHWFGKGHWLWMMPIETDKKELSIGITHHKNIIPSKNINSFEKVKSFLGANHSLLAELIEEGELVDFHYLPRLAHMSKQTISEDNWYVLGDAAAMFDPFYSPGLVMTAVAIESVTEAIKAKLAGEADAGEKQRLYNEFMTQYQLRYARIYQKHENQLGHASIMSWRIYLENVFWFGIMIPMYVGKWFLNPRFIKVFSKSADYLFFNEKYNLFGDFYQQFEALVERNVNIGLMDYTRADQLIGDFGPQKFLNFDSSLYNTRFEPWRFNIFAGLKLTYFYVAIYYLKLRYKGFGILGVLSPLTFIRVGRILGKVMVSAIAEQIFLLKTRKVPNNSTIENMRKDFKDYNYQSQLQPWNS
jgi:flavin-dependent dehydrogenase